MTFLGPTLEHAGKQNPAPQRRLMRGPDLTNSPFCQRREKRVTRLASKKKLSDAKELYVRFVSSDP